MFSSAKTFTFLAVLFATASVQAAYSGVATWYNTGLGACGETSYDHELIAAVAVPVFDNYPGYARGNPNNNPICGRRAKVTWGGKSVNVKIQDVCPGCGDQGIDLSPAAFMQLASLDEGVLPHAKWTII
ncbi:hypothetical protein L218DRAFT_947186 [Marasmius fiardii PR-910]|nr:hypothetical protein L218DRAFT_947186 [Marasmius fiardii PR-910]